MDSSESGSSRRRDFTRWPTRAVAIFAAGAGIGFGLCSVGLVTGEWFDLKDFGAGMFLLCLAGLIVSFMWLIVSIVISAVLSHRDEKRDARGNV